MGFFQYTDFCTDFFFKLKYDKLSACPLNLSQVSTGRCVMYACLPFSLRQVNVTSCTQWLAYISACGRCVSLLAPGDSLTFQRAAGASILTPSDSFTFKRATGACHFLHPVARLHFSVRQTRVTSCTRWLAYISACGRCVSLLAPSDSHHSLTLQGALQQTGPELINIIRYRSTDQNSSVMHEGQA